MAYFKGTITLYNWDYKLLVTGKYESKQVCEMLFKNWTERYKSQAHHVVISPLLEWDEELKLKRECYHRRRVKLKKWVSEPMVVVEAKKEIIRPPAEYSNKTPFGIAQHNTKEKIGFEFLPKAI